MAFVHYLFSFVVILVLVNFNIPLDFIIGLAILMAGLNIADAIRDGSDKISNSINKSIRDAITEIKEANLEQKLK